MAHPIHKIVGPMLRTYDPKTKQKRTSATVKEIEDVLILPVGLRAPATVVEEWLNEARRRNGFSGTSERIGEAFRTEMELRRRPKAKAKPSARRLSRLQRMARRVTRLFAKR